MVRLWAQQRLLPPTRAFELQEGRGAVTGPLRLIAEREAGFLFLPSLSYSSQYTINLSLSPFLCLSFLSLHRYKLQVYQPPVIDKVFFFNILVDHRNHKEVKTDRQSPQIFDKLITVPAGNIDM